MAPDALRPGIRSLQVGQTIRLTELISHLVAFAYEPVSVVEEPGTFSQRGGILDIYPPNADAAGAHRVAGGSGREHSHL